MYTNMDYCCYCGKKIELSDEAVTVGAKGGNVHKSHRRCAAGKLCEDKKHIK